MLRLSANYPRAGSGEGCCPPPPGGDGRSLRGLVVVDSRRGDQQSVSMTSGQPPASSLAFGSGRGGASPWHGRVRPVARPRGADLLFPARRRRLPLVSNDIHAGQRRPQIEGAGVRPQYAPHFLLLCFCASAFLCLRRTSAAFARTAIPAIMAPAVALRVTLTPPL